MENLPAESKPKGRYQLKYRGIECSNCGHPLDMSDRFCPQCSQINSTKKLTVKDFFDEFFASLISYDSKLLKTLSALLLRPGKITRDYVSGKRVSYTNPFRFLLSLSIIYFLMVNYGGNYSKYDKFGAKGKKELAEKFRNWSITSGLDDSDDFKSGLDSLANEAGNKISERDSLTLRYPAKSLKRIDDDAFQERFSKKQAAFYLLIREDSLYDFSDAEDKYQVPSSFENKWAFSAANGLLNLQLRPGSYLSGMISKIPFAVFFFLPVFALFIFLVYIRKKYNYTDHLIFSFHIQSLLFILLIISFLIDAIFDVFSSWAFLIIFSIYLFQSMRKFYEQGIFKTLVKYLFLNVVFFILALTTIVLLFAGGVFTY